MECTGKPVRILGVVAEYDPFHRGHEKHLRLAKEAVQPDFTYIVLSGCFRQRGDPAMLSPYCRARCALASGADAVFALPALWTVRDAEHYALGAVSLLRDLGATHLAFGAETAEPELLRRAAELLEYPAADFRERLRAALDAGEGYPRALSLAAASTEPELARMMNRPNNILAVCYLRALMRLEAPVTPVPVLREGGYHAEEIDPENPSASAVQDALRRGDYARALAAVPEESRGMIRKAFLTGGIPDPRVYDALLIRRLRTMTREEIRNLPDVSEGLEDRLREAAKRSNTRRELLDLVSGKRYPRARISRICAWALLNGRRDDPDREELPRKAVLLGLRRNPEMTALWREKGDLITEAWEDRADLLAWQIRAQCTGKPDTLPWTERVAVFPRKDSDSF